MSAAPLVIVTAVLPDPVLVIAARLRMSRRWRRRLDRERDLRRGSDRSGPRVHVDLGAWLRSIEPEERTT